MAIKHSDVIKVETLVAELLSGMKVNLKAEVSANTDGIKINLVGEDSAILIGFHGETLADFSYLVGIMVKRMLDNDIVVRVDAGDYLVNKDKRIKDMAQKAIEKVQKSGFPESLTGLNSYERRLVHAEVSKVGLESTSEGFGHDRKIVIKPTSPSSS